MYPPRTDQEKDDFLLVVLPRGRYPIAPVDVTKMGISKLIRKTIGKVELGGFSDH